MDRVIRVESARLAELDGEHRVQAWLIQALCTAVDTGGDAAQVAVILDQLLNYSKAHFMSEELLMRLDSYDGYEAHVADHERMVEALEAMQKDMASGCSTLVPGKARAMLDFLLRHIKTRDADYAAWTPI